MGSEIKGNSGEVGVRCVLFDSLLQKESLVARVLNTGDFRTEASELVEISDIFD